ncbi:MAG TPA: hypothetical protein DCZ94_08005 [Lentisphaeria bacterium]|nr:MAG: hypothetical protein A2X48_19480 [Lentisphaerae bacterium GWF2_49_21]HBC86881.1 hypothetical protein [Lentisphaeria bacterium]
MFYRTIDYLACPSDKNPLIADKITQCSEIKNPSCHSRCRLYCAFKGVQIPNGIAPEDCGKCHRLEIITATLKCPRCGTAFPVKDGIARLLPVEKDIKPELQTSMAVKKSEMKARDEFSAEYDLKFPPGRDLLETKSFLKRLSLSGYDAVLELGSGTGRLTMSMLPSCKEIICIDLSFESLKELSRKIHLQDGGTAHLIQADMNFIPLRKEYLFEKIACSGAIQHVPADSKIDAIKEIDRYLAGNGIFVVSAYNHSEMTVETREKEGYHSGRIYFYRYDQDEFKDFLSSVFRVCEIAGMINLPTHKVVGNLMKTGLTWVALALEYLIQRTKLSFRRGEMLIAVCRKKS